MESFLDILKKISRQEVPNIIQSLTSCRVMMAQYSLTWELFSQNFKGLLQNTSFQNFDLPEPFDDQYRDVTLVSNDYVSFKANKLVLSACSPVFQSIITDLPQKEDSTTLRGILSQEMKSILQFMYLGQATFYQDRMNEFIDVAKSLEVKEISKNVDSNQTDSSENDYNESVIEHDQNEDKNYVFEQTGQSETKLKRYGNENF